MGFSKQVGWRGDDYSLMHRIWVSKVKNVDVSGFASFLCPHPVRVVRLVSASSSLSGRTVVSTWSQYLSFTEKMTFCFFQIPKNCCGLCSSSWTVNASEGVTWRKGVTSFLWLDWWWGEWHSRGVKQMSRQAKNTVCFTPWQRQQRKYSHLQIALTLRCKFTKKFPSLRRLKCVSVCSVWPRELWMEPHSCVPASRRTP